MRDDSVIAALITAVSSIVVALISRTPKERSGGRRSHVRHVDVSKRPWMVTGVFLAVWLMASPGLVHHDLADSNFLLLPVVALVLALASPIRPLVAVSMTFAAFAFNSVAGPWSNRLAHSKYDDTLPTSNPSELKFILALTFGTAILVYVFTTLRRRQLQPATIELPGPAGRNGHNLVADLNQLGELHKTGLLSSDEFLQAKTTLLEQARAR